MTIADKKINELNLKSKPALDDRVILEDTDGTKLVTLEKIKTLVAANNIVDNIAMMKTASLREGEICQTLGYYKAGDGGGAKYMIVYAPTASPDEATIIGLKTSDTLRAKFIPEGDIIVPEQFGARGDGSSDDYYAINKCIESGYNIRFMPQKTYCLSQPLTARSNLVLELNGCTLLGPLFRDDTESTDSTIVYENIIIKNGTLGKSPLYGASAVIRLIPNTKNIILENLVFLKSTSDTIVIGDTESFYVDNCTFLGAPSHDAISFRCNKSTKSMNVAIRNCSFVNYYRCVHSYASVSTYKSYIYNKITNIASINIENCTFDNKDEEDPTSNFGHFFRDDDVFNEVDIKKCSVTSVESAFYFVTNKILHTDEDNRSVNYHIDNCIVFGNYFMSVSNDSSLSKPQNYVNVYLGPNTIIWPEEPGNFFDLLRYCSLYYNSSTITTDNQGNSFCVDYNRSVDSKVRDICVLQYNDYYTYYVDSDGKISLNKEVRNIQYAITNESTITAIEGGVYGQTVTIRGYSNDKEVSIIKTDKIILKNSSKETLSPYKSITLQKIDYDSTWVQI